MAQRIGVVSTNTLSKKRANENAHHKPVLAQDTGEGNVIFQGLWGNP